MRNCASLATLAVAISAAPVALASGWEIQGLVGRTAPTYSQTFSWSPPSLDLPGVQIQQSGTFDLDASGGPSVAGGLTYFLSDGVGLEGRIDTADVTLETGDARFSARVELPAPFPDLDAELDLAPATVNLKRLTPLSLNLRLRIPGPVAIGLSGGVSYLPGLELDVIQPLAVGVTGFDIGLGTLELGELGVRAALDPEQSGSRLGVNLGVGVQVRLSDAISLGVEARGFLFPERRLVWSAAPGRALSALEEELTEEVLSQLEPVEFSPSFVNAGVGLSISF